MCTASYFLPILGLLSGIVAAGARNAAWRLRQPGVTWMEGPGDIALLRPALFTEEGNRLRRRALGWYAATLVLMIATVAAAYFLVGGDGQPCWRT